MNMNNYGLGCGKQERGAALIAVLLLATVLVTVVLTATSSARREVRVGRNQYDSLRALDNAEAGLNHAYRLLVLNPSGFNDILAGNGVGGALANLGTATVTIAGLNYRFQNYGGSGNDGYYVLLQNNIDASPNDPTHDVDGVVNIISRGQAGDAVRVVTGVVAKNSSGSCLSATDTGNEAIKMTGGLTNVDGYNAVSGTYAEVFTNGGVDASGGSTFNVNVIAAGTINLHPATINGTQTQNAPTRSFNPVPACTPYSGSTGISRTYTYNSGNITVSGNNNITFAPGTYCFKKIKLSPGTLTINSGPVIINLTESLEVQGGSSFVNNTQVAANLQFSSSSGSQSTLSGGNLSYLTFNAPQANIVIQGGSTLYGSLIGKTLLFSGGSVIHCGSSGGVQLVNWYQVQ
jgi:hypothetical protein